jgi:hypothetical protein
MQLGVVAQQGGVRQLLQERLRFRIDLLARLTESTLGCVAAARHLEVRVGGDHRLHGHFVAGQGAGLVGADDADRAQGFHRGQAADDGVAVRHAGDADGQRDGHDRRQSFRDRRHRQAHRGEEHVARRVIAHPYAETEHQRRQRDDGRRQPLAEARHLLQQGRGELFHRRQQGADAAQLGLAAGGHHHAGALAVGDQGAGPGHAAAVAERGFGLDRFDLLVDCQRLAGQRSLHQAQRLDIDQAQVGRDAIPGCQVNDVAGHQVLGGDFVALPRARHGGVRRKHVADRIERLFGASFLDVADQGVDHDHAEDHAAVERMAEQRGDDPGRQQHIDQDVVELQQEALPARGAGRRRQQVGTILFPPLFDLGVAQAFTRNFKSGQDFAGGQAVPVGVGFAGLQTESPVFGRTVGINSPYNSGTPQ